MEFSKQELALFFTRLEQLFDNGQLVIGAVVKGKRRDIAAQLHLGVRPRDGKHAVLIDVEILEEQDGAE